MVRAKESCVSKAHVASSIPPEDQISDLRGEPWVVGRCVARPGFTHCPTGPVYRSGPVSGVHPHYQKKKKIYNHILVEVWMSRPYMRKLEETFFMAIYFHVDFKIKILLPKFS